MRWLGLRALGVAAIAAVVLTVASTGSRRHPVAAALAADAGTATLTFPANAYDTCGSCLPSSSLVFLYTQVSSANPIPLTVSATPPAGATIKSVVLQYAPAGTTDFAKLPLTHPFTGSAGTYIGQMVPFNDIVNYFNPDPNAPFSYLDGNYDIRALVTDTDGSTFTSQTVRNVAIASDDENDNDTFVGIKGLPSVVSGSVNLVAAPEGQGSAVPDTVAFQISPAGQGQWTPIGSPASPELNGAGNPILDAHGQQEYETTLDTTGFSDGQYDIEAVPQDSGGDTFLGGVITVTISNAPPSVTLATPSSPLRGSVALSATASAASGITSVRFQQAPAGSGSWTTVGVATTDPTGSYTVDWDTLGAPNGSYDLRAVATDSGGQTQTSVVPGVTVSNATTATANNLTVTSTVVPATGAAGGSLNLLGEIPGSVDHEAWAYGYSTASAPVVDGSTLPYTAPAGSSQLVLLKYTDATGWQIADVLRNADGSGFAVDSDAHVSGQMTASGEAWIAVAQSGNLYLFHRTAGGQFLLDTSDSSALQALFGGNANLNDGLQLELGQSSDGTVYGTLLVPGQAARFAQAGSPAVSIKTALRYGQLVGGSWSVKSAAVPSTYVQASGSDVLTLADASPTGPGSGWALFRTGQAGSNVGNGQPQPLLLGSFTSTGWSFASTGLDALDLTGAFGSGLSAQAVQPQGLLAADGEVWIKADIASLGTGGEVVALYDPSSGTVTQSWCDAKVLAQSAGCADTLDANDPATLPDAVFQTARGPEALAVGGGNLDVYANGTWSAVAAPGFEATSGLGARTAIFADATDGWLAGVDAMGQISAGAPAPALAQWPEANENTLTAVALPPGGAGTGTSGALAVGLDGAALHYDGTQGWLTDPVPNQARSANLYGVAYDGTALAVAVGSLGTILDWNGTAWSADPASQTLTQDQLNAVAFGSDGQGWAVGTFGTILRYDGGAWTNEQIDAQDSGVDVTSVAVAGRQVYAVAGGHLIERLSDGSWQRVPAEGTSGATGATVPDDLPALTLVSGLPDGGAVAAGDSVLIESQGAGQAFQYSAQPVQGTAVALSAFRRSDGQVGAFVSVAPPPAAGSQAAFGFPSGDGDLLEQTGSGFVDLSRSQYPGSSTPDDGAPEPDPVLAVAAAPDGSAAWAVGGYAGTVTADGIGTIQPLQARASNWQTATIWRFDQGGPAQPPSQTQSQVSIPAQPDTVSFAYFSGALCTSECAEVPDAQPMVNLQGAATEIAGFATQPGGPAFAMLGGDAVGPTTDPGSGNGAVDLADLSSYLSPLGSVPLYAAYGPLDAVPTEADPAHSWDDAFAQAPAPFGLGATPSGITAGSSGGLDGSVHHYYSYEVSQNGGELMVIVLDNTGSSLDAAEPGQSAWLQAQLATASAQSLPVVVFAAQPLDSNEAPSSYQAGHAGDADQVATELADAGVLAVFTTSPSETDAVNMVPYISAQDAATSTQPQIPEYEGASVGYQESQNNGVLWYFASVDTATRTLTVQGIPVVQSLALEPLSGLTAARSSTLSFRAVGRRPAGTIPGGDTGTNPPGISNYVAIPSSSCSSCVTPSYSFTSSNPGVGNFVQASGSGSLYPKLTASGKTIASSTSGLFCAYNAGTTTVSVTSGLLTSSLTVTVEPGEIGQPCGTVAYAADDQVDVVPGKTVVGISSEQAGNPNATAPPPVVQTVNPVLPHITIPPPVPAVAAPTPVHPPSPTPFIVPSTAFNAAGPTITPLAPPPVTPVPPGGATAPAQSTAKREEKARKEASQSAYVIRPAGTSVEDWFYPAVGVMTVLSLMLIGGGLRPGVRRKPALAEVRQYDDPDHRRPVPPEIRRYEDPDQYRWRRP